MLNSHEGRGVGSRKFEKLIGAGEGHVRNHPCACWWELFYKHNSPGSEAKQDLMQPKIRLIPISRKTVAASFFVTFHS